MTSYRGAQRAGTCRLFLSAGESARSFARPAAATRPGAYLARGFTGCQPGHPRSTSEGLWNYVILWYGKDLKKSDFRAPFEPFAAVQVAQIAALLIVVAIQCMLAQQPAGVLRDQLSSRVSIVGEPV
jgi:hypothetical protein